MSRPLRIELDDAVYQVMARGNARDRIFFDDQEKLGVRSCIDTSVVVV